MQRLELRHWVWLLAGLGMVMAPHVERLPIWIPLAAGALMLWRFYIGLRRQPLLPKWLLFLLAIAAFARIYLNYGRIFGRDTGVALLMLDRKSVV